MKKFWLKVKKTRSCWEWIGGKSKNGYGMFWHESKMQYAHRFSYKLKNKTIPVDKIICHMCNNKICVKPSHLYAGTVRSNTLDFLKIGKGKRKLSNEDVFKIRQQFYIIMAKHYGVHPVTIRNILNKETWSHI